MLCSGGCTCRSWLLSVLQDALDAMTKEKARLRADMEYLQSQLDLVTQQAEAAACKDSSEGMSEVHLLSCSNDRETAATKLQLD